MKLILDELDKIFNIVIKNFNQRGIKKISFFSEDYYPLVKRQDLDFLVDKPLCLKKYPSYGLGSLDWNFEVWKGMLSDKDAVWGMSSGIQIEDLGGILTAFGQISDKLSNPDPIKNILPEGYPKEKPPVLTIYELQKSLIL